MILILESRCGVGYISHGRNVTYLPFMLHKIVTFNFIQRYFLREMFFNEIKCGYIMASNIPLNLKDNSEDLRLNRLFST